MSDDELDWSASRSFVLVSLSARWSVHCVRIIIKRMLVIFIVLMAALTKNGFCAAKLNWETRSDDDNNNNNCTQDDDDDCSSCMGRQARIYVNNIQRQLVDDVNKNWFRFFPLKCEFLVSKRRRN